MTAVVRAPVLPLAAIELYLDAQGLKATYPDAVRVRGVGDATDIKKVGAGRGLIISRGAGPGLAHQMHFDQAMVTLRVIGKQNDYDDGEAFAAAVDGWMLAPGNVQVGTVLAQYVVRAGGGPAHIQTDKGRRAHFSVSYIIPVASGL